LAQGSIKPLSEQRSFQEGRCSKRSQARSRVLAMWASTAQDNSRRDVRREQDEEESWGSYMGGMIWSVVAGGRKCCSMRERGETEAAKRASESGRPPKRSCFPDPPQGADAPPPADRKRGSDVSGAPRNRQAPFSAGAVPGRESERGRGVPPPRSPRIDYSRDACGGIGGGGRHVEPGMGSRRWEWPAWCLDFQKPMIEVFVKDEETGRSLWVAGEPQSRVVDKTGRDVYLSAEYDWGGEYYVQDFGPQHVRRRGEHTTVLELLQQEQSNR